jgi:hypothetical protein
MPVGGGRTLHDAAAAGDAAAVHDERGPATSRS